MSTPEDHHTRQLGQSDPYGQYAGAGYDQTPYDQSAYDETGRDRTVYDRTAYDDEDSPLLGTGRDTIEDDRLAEPTRPRWHAGADLGLLVLRLVVGALFIGHGLQRLFGLLDGPGIDGTARMLTEFGFQRPTLLAWVTGVIEVGGGALVVLGLFTPLGVAALLGVIASAIWVRVDTNVFAGGVELEAVYAAALGALLFAGPGRVSFDRPTPWYRNALAYGFVCLLISAGATVATLMLLRN